jgi:hypothetical protein
VSGFFDTKRSCSNNVRDLRGYARIWPEFHRAAGRRFSNNSRLALGLAVIPILDFDPTSALRACTARRPA